VKRVSVPRDLSRAHPVVRKLLEADVPRRTKYWAATYKSLYDAPYFDSPFEQRRLRALNALFLCLEQNDARITSSGKNPHEFYARVGLTDVVISIDDPKVERTSWHATSDIAKSASGTLAVMINRGSLTDEFQSTWQDKPNDKIESHLTEIAVNVLVAGESACRSKELAHYEWLVRRKADLIERSRIEREKAEQAERERRVKEEQARVDRLLSEAKALREAQEIRAYVASVKALNETSQEPIPETDIASWATWALEQADRIDPIRSRRFLSDQA